MEVTNEIKRTRKKLKLLENEEGVNWLLFDLIDEINKQMNEDEPVPESEKVKLIKQLTKKYQSFLKKNCPEDPKQTKIWKNLN